MNKDREKRIILPQIALPGFDFVKANHSQKPAAERAAFRRRLQILQPVTGMTQMRPTALFVREEL
jgi:hypothetical protein